MDKINPKYYRKHPSGVECIDITRHYCFDIGNAIKYLWRAGLKQEEGYTSTDKEIEDLYKALWYIEDRIKQLNMIRKQSVNETLDKVSELLDSTPDQEKPYDTDNAFHEYAKRECKRRKIKQSNEKAKEDNR